MHLVWHPHLMLHIFVLLVFLSIVTWAIIIGKSVQLRREDQNSGQFVKAFNKVKSLKSFVPANRKRAPVDYDLGIMFEELMDESGIMVPDWRMDVSPEELEEIMYLECLFKDLYLNKIAMA